MKCPEYREWHSPQPQSWLVSRGSRGRTVPVHLWQLIPLQIRFAHVILIISTYTHLRLVPISDASRHLKHLH